MERITYLVANYNCSKYIEECLTSLAEQTCGRWNCLICDDASTDNSLAIIAHHLQPNIHVLRNRKNIGCAATVKRLIEEAETDIVGVLDADDALFENATEEILKVYDQNKKAELVYSCFRVFDERLTIAGKQFGWEVPQGSTSLQRGYITHLKTFRKSAYDRTEGMDLTMEYAEDRDLVYKLEEVTPAIFLEKAIYKYRSVPNSQSRDEKKRETGLVNHVRAKNNALARRHIRGFEKAVYEIFIRLDYVSMSHRYGSLTRMLTRCLMNCLLDIDRALKIRSSGQLRWR